MEEYEINYNNFKFDIISFNNNYYKKIDYEKIMSYERYSERIDLYNLNCFKLKAFVDEAFNSIEQNMILQNKLLDKNDIEYFFNNNLIIYDLVDNQIKKYINQRSLTLFWLNLIHKEEDYNLTLQKINDIIKEMQIKFNCI